MKRIVLTGGGTAGHVTPNIALLPRLRQEGYEISYIGTYTGMERGLIEEQGVPYYGISSGKLRRYFSWKNFTDPFRVLHGFFQCLRLLKKLKPDLVFSKGGFVSVPVLLAARLRRIPAIIHESDITPGLANRIAFSSATKICCNFPETVSYLPKGKADLPGSPIRQELLSGDKEAARALCHFTSDKKVLLIVGGSLGSQKINQAIRHMLPQLLEQFQIIHLCGKGNLDPQLNAVEGYMQMEYASSELRDLFSLADLVISRAGANAICELLALHLPNILIPLSAAASRGDQILNARSFEKQGFSYVLEEENLSAETLFAAIQEVDSHRDVYLTAMEQSQQLDSIGTILSLMESVTKK